MRGKSMKYVTVKGPDGAHLMNEDKEHISSLEGGNRHLQAQLTCLSGTLQGQFLERCGRLWVGGPHFHG